MEITLLVQSIAGLVVILGILIFIFLYMQSVKREKENKKLKLKNRDTARVAKKSVSHDLLDLLEVIRDKKSTTQELAEALDLIIKYHGHIHSKLGIRPHPDFNIYSEILLRICRHPNTNKDIIVKFDRELEKLNPEYIREINDSLTKGLNSRGI